MIYFDNAATMPVCEASFNELMTKTKTIFGNPSTKYSIGVFAKRVLEDSRKKISNILHCDTEDLFFTSGGTEGNNIIIQSILRSSDSYSHVIVSSIEHSSVLNVLKALRGTNIKVTEVCPDKNGIVDPREIEKAITPETKLIIVQMINNEIGAIEPVKEIASLASKYLIHYHVDAVQAVGHVAIDISDLNVSSLSASAHKFGGPKGIGFIFTKKHDVALCYGGGQEKMVKSGTENVASISAMAVALEDATKDLAIKMEHINHMVEYLESSLAQIEGVHLNIDNHNYHAIISFRVDDVSNEALVNYFDLKDICVSTGSACSGNSIERSHVLFSIGLSEKQIDESIRISLSCNNTIEECQIFINVLKEAILKLRR